MVLLLSVRTVDNQLETSKQVVRISHLHRIPNWTTVLELGGVELICRYSSGSNSSEGLGAAADSSGF
jgi:hypothetical protein